jgi:hypothetical protein
MFYVFLFSFGFAIGFCSGTKFGSWLTKEEKRIDDRREWTQDEEDVIDVPGDTP